jgi:DNA-binding PadR family transcriptional regulator
MSPTSLSLFLAHLQEVLVKLRERDVRDAPIVKMYRDDGAGVEVVQRLLTAWRIQVS